MAPERHSRETQALVEPLARPRRNFDGSHSKLAIKFIKRLDRGREVGIRGCEDGEVVIVLDVEAHHVDGQLNVDAFLLWLEARSRIALGVSQRPPLHSYEVLVLPRGRLPQVSCIRPCVKVPVRPSGVQADTNEFGSQRMRQT